jgi:hypothetical protein
MSIAGAETDWWQVFMAQNSATVATPSALGAGSFSVAYTGTQNAVAGPVNAGGPAMKVGSQPRGKVMNQRVSER